MAFGFVKKLAIGGLTGRLLPGGIGGKLGSGFLGGKITRGLQAKAGFGGATKRSRKKTGRR